jgi:predicted dehydrogenase
MNIGIIGCGMVVEQYHLPVLASLPGTKLKWLCDISVERTQRLASAWNVEGAFQSVDECGDVDAVLVATPVGSRGEILARTTAKGWHALCEKPFASSAIEHRRFLDDASPRDVKLGAGYMRRYYWAVRKAKELLRSGAVGNLTGIVASDSAHLQRTGIDLQSYRNNTAAAGGGVLVESGCHLIDQVLCLTEAAEFKVQACVQKTWEEYEVETDACGHLVLASGMGVPFQFTISGVRPVFSGIALRCELAEIRVPIDPSRGLDVLLGDSRPQRLEIPHPRPGDRHVFAAFRCEWEHFLLRCAGAECDSADETGVLVTEFIEECNATARTPSEAGVCQWVS